MPTRYDIAPNNPCTQRLSEERSCFQGLSGVAGAGFGPSGYEPRAGRPRRGRAGPPARRGAPELADLASGAASASTPSTSCRRLAFRPGSARADETPVRHSRRVKPARTRIDPHDALILCGANPLFTRRMHAVLCEPGEADDGGRTRDLRLGKVAPPAPTRPPCRTRTTVVSMVVSNSASPDTTE